MWPTNLLFFPSSRGPFWTGCLNSRLRVLRPVRPLLLPTILDRMRSSLSSIPRPMVWEWSISIWDHKIPGMQTCSPAWFSLSELILEVPIPASGGGGIGIFLWFLLNCIGLGTIETFANLAGGHGSGKNTIPGVPLGYHPSIALDFRGLFLYWFDWWRPYH